MPNPYTVRPVVGNEYFAADHGGRGTQARLIYQNVCRADPLPDSISLVGERRFGKTSLLRYIQSTITDIPDLYLLYIDMLDLNPLTPAGFYERLMEGLSSANISPLDCAAFSYRDFRSTLVRLGGFGQRLVLLVDEFDLVVRDHHFDLSFFDNLRSAATTLPLALIVASVQPLARIAHQGVYGSPFFNIFQEERLRPLNTQEIQALIRQPPGGERGLEEAANEIMALAGHHPYFLQMACYCAWNLREEGHGKLEIASLQRIFQKKTRGQYQYIWDHCSTTEQQILCLLAQGISVEKNEALSLIERGYIIEETALRICGTGLEAFLKEKATSIIRISDNDHYQKTPAYPPDRSFTNSTALLPITIFLSYADEDEPFRKDLEKHLSTLKQQYIIYSWYNRKVPSRDGYMEMIDDRLDTASIILLLISPDFLASNYCQGREMQRVMERYKAKEAIVIPVILRHIDWHSMPFSELQPLPSEGKPIAAWQDRDEAFLSVTRGVRLAIEQMRVPRR